MVVAVWRHRRRAPPETLTTTGKNRPANPMEVQRKGLVSTTPNVPKAGTGEECELAQACEDELRISALRCFESYNKARRSELVDVCCLVEIHDYAFMGVHFEEIQNRRT